MSYVNHVATTRVDIPLTVTAAAQRELHGTDETLPETTEAVIEAYTEFLGEILTRKFDDGDIDADGGITVTAEDIQLQREMNWVPTLGDDGIADWQRPAYEADCKRLGIDDSEIPW